MCCVPRGILGSLIGLGRISLLFFAHLLHPNVNHFFQVPSSEIAKGCVLPQRLCLFICAFSIRGPHQAALVFKAEPELFGEPGKFLLSSVSAEDNKDFLPVFQVGILYHVCQIASYDRLVEAKVW